MINIEKLKKIATEAKEKADKATTGNWVYSEILAHDEPSLEGVDVAIIDEGVICQIDYDQPRNGDWRDTAKFIANARTSVPLLAQGILDLIEENDALKKRFNVGGAVNVDWEKYNFIEAEETIKTLQSKLDKATKALEFYGDEDNWSESKQNTTSNMIGGGDHVATTPFGKVFKAGFIARQTLKEINNES